MSPTNRRDDPQMWHHALSTQARLGPPLGHGNPRRAEGFTGRYWLSGEGGAGRIGPLLGRMHMKYLVWSLLAFLIPVVAVAQVSPVYDPNVKSLTDEQAESLAKRQARLWRWTA